MNEFKQGTPIGEYTVLYNITNKAYTQTYCVADPKNDMFFMKLYDMQHIPDTLVHGEAPQEIWVYKQLGMCDNLMHVEKYGFEVIQGNKVAYFVTRYFRGKLLSQYVDEQGRLSAEETIEIALGIVNAVRHLNEHHLCHLDITPQNILLEAREDGGFTPKLFDLEHAYEYADDGSTKCAARRLEKISPYYSRGELLATHDIVEADDTFSIGAVIYFMLSGKRPWNECQLSTTMPLSERHIKMNRFRREHPAPTFIETLRPSKVDITQTSANLYVAMMQTMNNSVATDTLERILLTENTELDKIAIEVSKSENRTAEQLRGFAAIAGMDELKQNLSQRVLWPLRHPDKAKQYRLHLPNGLLLYGPPGCGKTYFATRLADELNWHMKLVSTATIGSSYQHETQTNIRNLFEDAAHYKGCVLCIDEIDGILSTRNNNSSSHGHNDEVNELLVQLNNCNERNILVVGTTNRKEMIDPAALRAGRFDLQIEIKEPDIELRQRLFEMYLRNRPLADDLNIAELAQMTPHYASADIPFVVNEAALVAAIADEPIGQNHLVNVIRTHKSSLQSQAPRVGF